MQINLPGVLVDGTAPVTATPARQDVVVYQGVDTAIRVTVTGSNGLPIDLTGYTGALVVKDRLLPAEGQPRVTKGPYPAVLTSPALGIITFTVPGTDLKGLNLVGYWYDVFVTSSTAKRDEVVITSTMTVNAAVGA